MFVEGYDAQLMGYVVPGIARDWGVTPGSLTAAIAAGLIGMMLGGFLIAPLADSYGRRRVVLYSVIVFAILTIATAFDRIEMVGDLFAPARMHRQDLHPALQQLRGS